MWWRCEAELIRLALTVRCASRTRRSGFTGLLRGVDALQHNLHECVGVERVTNPFQPSRGYLTSGLAQLLRR